MVARLAVLIGLGVILAALVATVAYDLVTNPRDIYTATTFLAGTLVGVTLDRGRRRG